MIGFTGTVASWGMGTSSQLGNGEEDDSWVPSKMDGKQLQERYVIGLFISVFFYQASRIKTKLILMRLNRF